MTADDLAELELSYAPPFGSAKDPVNMVGFVAQNALDGTAPQWHPDELDEVRRDTLVLDVRTYGEFSRGHLPGAMHVPHTQVRDHLEKIRAAAAGRPISVHCQSGVRSYLATRMLIGAGMDARNLSGGWLSLVADHPELRTSTVPTQPKEPATV
jgi:rhodanese-related sulfurtransferase